MPKRLMIVDDSPVMRACVRKAVDVAGLPVPACLEALDGREALEKLRRDAVDLILTGISMPDMDGEGFLTALREDESLRSIPVVVCTGSTQQRAGEPEFASEPIPASWRATTAFDGSLQGRPRLSVSKQFSGWLAAAFPGLKASAAGIAEQQLLAAGLTNMICGSAMSSLQPAGRLLIEQRGITDSPFKDLEPWLRFPFGDGELRISIRYRRA